MSASPFAGDLGLEIQENLKSVSLWSKGCRLNLETVVAMFPTVWRELVRRGRADSTTGTRDRGTVLMLFLSLGHYFRTVL